MTAMTQPRGHVLDGRYRLERELGRGGMAMVHLAEDLRHPRKVAVKVLHPELAGQVGVDQFLHEISVTAKLQHPHILPLLDSGTWDGLPYYVMPYVACKSLYHSRYHGRKRPLQDVYRLTRQVADPLDYSHANDIIHLDIKPENILLSKGHAYVGDFGIARAVCERCLTEGVESLSFGTPEYMSPEQATGADILDNRSDVYSLACVVYEMLTGAPPFRGITAEAVLFHQVTSPARPISHVRDDVPASVEAVILRALAKLPRERPATAGALVLPLAEAAAASRWHPLAGGQRARHSSGQREPTIELM
jgi:serine/threonine-protein kinase